MPLVLRNVTMARARLPFVVACLIAVLRPLPAEAGLIIEVDTDVDTSGLVSVSAVGDDLELQSEDGAHTIRLPANALPLVALWASHYAGDPMVISHEIAAVSSGDATYFSPAIPLQLRDALLHYDGEHTDVACAAVPADATVHPLFARTQDASLFPAEEHVRLLTADEPSAEAFWYRQLTARYVDPPVCSGGEVTIRAVPAEGALPVRLEVRSHAYVQTQLWYRKIQTMHEPERARAGLPHRQLKRDVEQRWDAYRRAFPPLDEVSSIIEALAVLQALRRQRPELWSTFCRQVVGPSEELWTDDIQPSRVFRGGDADYRDENVAAVDRAVWDELVWDALVADTAATPEKLDLAIALAMADDPARQDLQPLLAAAAHSTPPVRARWELAQATWALDGATPDIAAARRHADAFFTLVADAGDWRLHADGLGILAGQASYVSVLDDPPRRLRSFQRLLRREQARARTSFVSRARRACALSPEAAAAAVETWEQLSRDALATGLFSLLSEGGPPDSELAGLRACIHHRRGLATHVGKDVFFRHAHFRFLKYLAEQLPFEPALAATIHDYRSDLAIRLGLHSWDEEAVDAMATVQDGEPTTIEGDLLPSVCLFAVQPFACARTMRDGTEPLGVYASGRYFVLLADGSPIAAACGSAAGGIRVRAEGIPLDGGLAFSPSAIEVFCGGAWLPVEVGS